MTAEQFVCLNCLSVGELNQHGRCGTCDSDSVLSRERIVSASQTPRQTPKDASVHGYLVTHPSGFETFVSHTNRAIAYNECADPLTKWYVSAGMEVDPATLTMKAMTRNEYIDWIKRERS